MVSVMCKVIFSNHNNNINNGLYNILTGLRVENLSVVLKKRQPLFTLFSVYSDNTNYYDVCTTIMTINVEWFSKNIIIFYS